MLKTIALIGQPNVGKSSLFNRIARQRLAIISEVSGTTRDTKELLVDILEKEALLIDTGGIDKSTDVIFSQVKNNAIKKAKEADIILYMVDGKQAPHADDKILFHELEKMGKDIALVVNKIDNNKEEENLWAFYEFGIAKENILTMSVSHNRGTKKLFAWLDALLEEKEQELIISEDEDESLEDFLNPPKDVNEDLELEDDIKIGIIGRVNVGKSSILNALVGKERSVVSEIAGTTIDTVDEKSMLGDREVTFVDTAGLRKRGKIEGLEKYALMRTKKMLEKASIALLILDASKKFTDLDEKIAGLADTYGLGVIIVFNKWDENMETFKKTEAEFRIRFKFLHYAPIIAVSAVTKRNIDKLKTDILKIYDNYSQRIPTAKLNRLIEEATKRHKLPSPNGSYLRIYYATQFKTRPPQIAMIMNKPKLLHFSYKRYLVNFLREQIDFNGTPIHIIARGKSDNLENKEDS